MIQPIQDECHKQNDDHIIELGNLYEIWNRPVIYEIFLPHLGWEIEKLDLLVTAGGLRMKLLVMFFCGHQNGDGVPWEVCTECNINQRNALLKTYLVWWRNA